MGTRLMRAVYRRRGGAQRNRPEKRPPARCQKRPRPRRCAHARCAKRRSMNTLTDAQRDRVLALLREGKSLRRIQDETGHRRETIAAYGRRAGLLDGGVTRLPGAAPATSTRERAGE